MRRNRHVVGAAFAALIVGSAATASALPMEVGVMGGYHLFSDDLELGVLDEFTGTPESDQPKSFIGFGARVAVNVFSRLWVEGEGRYFPTEAAEAGGSTGVLGYNAHLLFELTKGKMRPFVVAGGGFHQLFEASDLDADNEFPDGGDIDEAFHYGLGVKMGLTDTILVRADFRHYLPPSAKDESFTNDFEGMIGVSFGFGHAKVIKITTETEPEPEPEPQPPADTDGDGNPDTTDKCVNEAEDKDGFEDDDGCPEADNDKDGVPDADDACRDEAGPVENKGCPDKDTDGDGFVDRLDKCPDVAEDKDGFEDEDGCDDPDNDADGVMDALDQCPAEQETRNGYKDDDGCKDDVPKALKKFTGVIKGINFKVASDLIQKNSFPLLDKAAKVLAEFPDVRVEISGHTDSDGERNYNIDLSQRRAESVKNYLIGKGLTAERLTAIGHGPDKPIADNAKKKGKAQNRRTEFRLINPGEEAAAPTPGDAGDAPLPAVP